MRIRVVDADGRLVAYARQKNLSLKQDVTIFADEAQTLPQYRLTQERMMGLTYPIETSDGRLLGKIKQHPQLSRATYELLDEHGEPLASILEPSAWIRMLDQFIGDIPFVAYGFQAVLKPTYFFCETNGATLLRLVKTPSMDERRFLLERDRPLSPQWESLALPAAIMVAVLERGDR